MEPQIPIAKPPVLAVDTRSLIAALDSGRLPPASDWLAVPALRAGNSAAFRFSYNEVPFLAQIRRANSRAVLSLTGEFGTLPYSIESLRRRRRLGQVLAAARRTSGLGWELTPRHEIRASCEAELADPPSPLAAVTAAIALLLKSRPYIELLVAVAGED